MKSIVFIGSYNSGTSKEALMVAREMGYWVVLFTDKNNQWDYMEANETLFIKNLFDEHLVMKKIAELQREGKEICACFSFIDPYVSYSIRLSNRLGVGRASLESLILMEDKITIREKFKHLSVSPHYWIIHPGTPFQSLDAELEPNLPLIIKAPVSNGSKDVLKVETLENLAKNIIDLQKRYPNKCLLIEEFLQGPQYLIELVVHHDEIKFIEIIEQEVIYNGKFIVMAYKYPAMLEEEILNRLRLHISSIIEQIGFSNGSCHMEMKLVQGEWKLIEINPRMSGGAMNRIIEEGTGINLLKGILKVYLGEEFSFIKTRKKYVYARYLTIEKRGKLLRVIGKERALEHDDIKYVQIKPKIGRVLKRPYSMGDRYACIIAASESAKQAEENTLAAAKEIKFYMEPF